MQFIVPQFIEVETKIIGPISVRQFIILLVDALFIYLAYEIFSFWLFLVMTVLLLGIGSIIAFVRINSQPFHLFALNFIQTFKRPQLRIWYKEFYKFKVKQEKQKEEEVTPVKVRPTSSHLAELSLLVDTGGTYKTENSYNKQKSINYGRSKEK